MKYLIIPIFFLALTFPHIDKAFDLDKTISRENRKLKTFPEIATTKLNSIPSEVSAYINDNFGFRKWFIKTNAKLKYHLFRSAPNKNICLLYTSPSPRDS